MIADASGETKRVAEFLGLTWDEAMLDERLRSGAQGGPDSHLRRRDKAAVHVRIGRWENYRRYLKPGLDILKPFVKAFGYEC